MDAKITKKRLNILLSYDWLKIIALIVAAIVLWSLLFTMTATRITAAQEFTVFNYLGTNGGVNFNGTAEKTLNGKEKVFSYEIFEVGATDLTIGKENAATILQARLSVGEGDALFAADVEDPEMAWKDEDGNELKLTYLEQFLYNYGNLSEKMDGEDGFLASTKRYLDGYYGGNAETGTLDESLVEKDFYARIASLKDKRFKTDAQKQEGLLLEKARIEGYKKNYIEFTGYLEKGYIALEEKTIGSGKYQRKGCYSVNLCPSAAKDEKGNLYMSDLKKEVYYMKEVTEEDGSKSNVPTAENVHLVLLDCAEEKYKYTRYESLSYINYLVRAHCSALKTA